MPPLPTRHPGIRIDKISPEGEMGFVFTIGVTTMILTSLPQARAFFALALPTGIIVGLILYLIHRRPPRHEKLIFLHLQDSQGRPPVPPHKVAHTATPPASGIRVEKISRLGEMSLVFTIGAMAAMAMILISLPEAHEFFAWSFPAGIIVGLILYLIHRRPPRREQLTFLYLQGLQGRPPVPPHKVAHCGVEPL